MKDNKPRIYIGGPFFNQPQIEIISKIQGMLTRHGFSYYSPRLDSGSLDLSPEDRKDPAKWKPIFQSNVDNLHTCGVLLAVVEYAMEKGTALALCHEEPIYRSPPLQSGVILKAAGGRSIELPDSGTVWEMGYVRALNDFAEHVSACGLTPPPKRPIVAFHSSKPPEKLNLMLSHGADVIVSGWSRLESMLGNYPHSFTNDVWKGEVE
jgi:nucleoside 2-deoxyribosyltransferase